MAGPRWVLMLLLVAMDLSRVSAQYLEVLNPDSQQCRGCVSKPENIPCTLTMRPSHCLHMDLAREKFPSAPRNLTIDVNKHNNMRRLLVKWTVPFDFSYIVLTGYELTVHMLPSPWTYCFNFNISTEDLKNVSDVHSTTFEFDCLQYSGRDRLTVDFMLFSLPKSLSRSEYIDRRVVIEALIWKPNVSLACVNGSLEMGFTNPFPNASHYLVQLYSNHMEEDRAILAGPHQKTYFNVTPHQNYSVRTIPMDAKGRELSKIGTRPIACAAPMPVTDLLATTASSISNNGSHSNPQRDGLILMICILILALVLLLVVFFIIMRRCRKGNRRGCWNLGHANPTLADEKVAVFPLYAADDELCTNVAKKHMKLLSKFGNVDISPYEQSSQAQGACMLEWLEQQLKARLLLFYSSRALAPDGSLVSCSDSPYSVLVEQALTKIKSLPIRNGIILNLEKSPVTSGSLEPFAEWKVLQLAGQAGDSGVELEDMQHLLSELYDGQPPLGAMAGWSSSSEAEELRLSLRTLWDSTAINGLHLQQTHDSGLGSHTHLEQIRLNGMAGSVPGDSPLHQPSSRSRFSNGYSGAGKSHAGDGKVTRNGRGPNRRKGHASRPTVNEGQGLLPPNRALPPPRSTPDVESDTDAFISPTDVESISGSEGDIIARLRRFNV